VMAAGIAASEGRTAEAIAGYRAAFADYADIGIRWEQALTGLDAALLLDPAEPEMVPIVAETRELLRDLGAQPFSRLLEERLREGAAGAAV